MKVFCSGVRRLKTSCSGAVCCHNFIQYTILIKFKCNIQLFIIINSTLQPHSKQMQKTILKFSLAVTLLGISVTGKAQSVSINASGAAPDTTAILDVNSSTKGLLIPRMTAQQKNSIANPATGLLIYQTDGDSGFYFFNGANWLLLITSAVNTDKQNTLIYTTKGF